MQGIPIDRRTFAAGVASLAVNSRLLAAAEPRLLAAAESGSDPFGGFQVGVQTFCWHRFPLRKMLTDVQGLGLHYVELFPGHAPLENSPAETRQVVKMCLDHDIKPIAFGVLPFTSDHDANKKVFEVAAELGVRSLGADPHWDSFDSLDKLVEEFQIPIAIHPHGPVRQQLHPWHRAEIILTHIKHHHPQIGTCLDTGHLIRCAQQPFHIELDPAEQIRLMGKRNFGIHLKDSNNDTDINVVYGQGELDVQSVLRALREVEFDRHISIEHEAHPEDPLPEIGQNVALLKQAVTNI